MDNFGSGVSVKTSLEFLLCPRTHDIVGLSDFPEIAG
jgi:hypothetical protein